MNKQRLLDEIKNLSAKEQREILEALGWNVCQHPAPMPEAQFEEMLLEKGIIGEIPPAGNDEEEAFEPVVVQVTSHPSSRVYSALRTKHLFDRIAQQHNQCKHAERCSNRHMEAIQAGYHEAKCVFLAPLDATASVDTQPTQRPAKQNKPATDYEKQHPKHPNGKELPAVSAKAMRVQHQHQADEDVDQWEGQKDRGYDSDDVMKRD
jgi:hypothetical protein